jgi:hypothetical protein
VGLKLKRQLLLPFIILLSIILISPPHNSLAQDFPDVCQQPENILANCTFDAGLDHWQTFTETGAASFSVLQGGGECHAPLCPAAYIVVDDHFVGGLYQQVPVTTGNNFYANIVWLVFDSLANDAGIHQATGGIGRRIGIDPFGGTDPTSANIVWSLDNWRNDCKICNIEQVTITAQADTITVFLRLDDTWKLRAAEQGFPVPPKKDQFWIDDMGLKPVSGDAIPALAPSPTDTPLPVPDSPTATFTPPPPADTPTSEIEPATEATDAGDVAVATEVAVASALAQAETPVAEPVSPVATPTPVPTHTLPPPPPTLTPTARPSPTDTPRPRPSPTRSRPRRATPEAEVSDLPLTLSAAGTTACAGGLILVVVAVVMAGMVWLYRLGWGSADDDEFDAGPPPSEPDDDPVELPLTEDDESNDFDNDTEVTDNVEP